MKLNISAALVAAALASVAAPADPLNSVDTLIGGSYRGHTFPGATCPFSLVQVSPDTGLCDWDHRPIRARGVSRRTSARRRDAPDSTRSPLPTRA